MLNMLSIAPAIISLLIANVLAAPTPPNGPTAECLPLDSPANMPIADATKAVEMYCGFLPQNIDSLKVWLPNAAIEGQSADGSPLNWPTQVCRTVLMMTVNSCKAKGDESKTVGGTIVVKEGPVNDKGIAEFGGKEGVDFTWKFSPVVKAQIPSFGG